jgi:plasmid stabilization system protein ParE
MVVIWTALAKKHLNRIFRFYALLKKEFNQDEDE